MNYFTDRNDIFSWYSPVRISEPQSKSLLERDIRFQEFYYINSVPKAILPNNKHTLRLLRRY